MDMMRECNGQVFWNTLVGIKRPPVDLTSSQITLSCGDRYAGASLMVAAGADSGRQEVLVRLLDGDNQVLVNAILDGKLQYLRGSSFGVPADDVAAATTLSMFGGELGACEWEEVPSGVLDVEDFMEDEDGDA